MQIHNIMILIFITCAVINHLFSRLCLRLLCIFNDSSTV